MIVADDIVYGSTDNWVNPDNEAEGRNMVYQAVNISTGTQIWNYSCPTYAPSNPAVVDGVFYFCQYGNGVLAALNATTGAWIKNITSTNVDDGCSPVVVDGVAYVTLTHNRLAAYNVETATQLWNHSFSPYYSVFAPQPMVANGRVYLAPDFEMLPLMVFNASTGSQIWNTSGLIDSPYSQVSCYNGQVFCASKDTDHRLYALNETNGAEIWNVAFADIVCGCPSIGNGLVYVPSDDGIVHALDFDNGTEVWTYDIELSGYDNEMTSIAITENIALFGSLLDTVTCLNATTGELIWEYYIGSSVDVFADPCIADGIAYVGADDDYTLYAFESAPLPPPPVQGSSSLQYYFRSDTYSTLGVSAYGLDADYTNTYQTSNITYPVYYGFRVWLASSATVSTELTSGTPTAYIYLNGSETYDSYSSTWLCPETTVNLGYQALKVTVYASTDLEEWTALANYITPVLITKQIEESTWAFTLQVAFDGANAVYSWGDSAHRSGVNGVEMTTPLESEIQLWRINSGDYVGFILGAYIDVIGEAFYVLCLIGVAGTLYFRYRNFGVIAFFFAIFGGAGGLVWFLVPPWAAAVTSALIIVGVSFLVWRVIR